MFVLEKKMLIGQMLSLTMWTNDQILLLLSQGSGAVIKFFLSINNSHFF